MWPNLAWEGEGGALFDCLLYWFWRYTAEEREVSRVHVYCMTQQLHTWKWLEVLLRAVDEHGPHRLLCPLSSSSNKVTCHAVACSETMQIAQLVARQRSSKRKMGRQVNCQMRLKNTSPVALAGKPPGGRRVCLCSPVSRPKAAGTEVLAMRLCHCWPQVV